MRNAVRTNLRLLSSWSRVANSPTETEERVEPGEVQRVVLELGPALVRDHAHAGRHERADGVHPALVSAEQPPLAQRGGTVHRGQQLVGLPAGAGDRARLVDEPVPARRGVGRPAVGDHGGAGFDCPDEELAQRLRAGVGDDAHPGPPVAAWFPQLHRDHHQRLAQRAASRRSGLLAADEGLIDLDAAGQYLTAGPDHRGPEAVQHRPRRLVGAQPEQSLHRQRRHPTRIGSHVPSRREPHRQRRARVLKIVPAVRETRFRHPPQRHTRPVLTLLATRPKLGHAGAPGQRSQSR